MKFPTVVADADETVAILERRCANASSSSRRRLSNRFADAADRGSALRERLLRSRRRSDRVGSQR